MQSILIVDDMDTIHEMLDTVVQPAGYATLFANNGEEAISIFKEKRPDIVLTDLRMSPVDGQELVKQLKEIDPSALIIIMTAHADLDNAMDCMKLGVFDYLTKPFKLDQLMSAINRADERIKEIASIQTDESNLILLGESPASTRLKLSVARLAESTSPALIKGPKGVEKALVAAAVHESQFDDDGAPFITEDCRELSAEEVREQLIGENSSGGSAIEEAKGGSLLLENIDGTPLELQAELGNAIRESKSEVRFLITSDADLEALAAEGQFDESLFYRISSLSVDCPNLEERSEDAPLFAQALLKELDRDNVSLSDEARSLLKAYRWPGNFTEFREVMETVSSDCPDGLIGKGALPERIRETSQWSTLSDYLESASRDYKRRVLSACQGDPKTAAKILGCEESQLAE